MKTAILYYSKHHGNTKKILCAIKEKEKNVDLFDITEKPVIDLQSYECIGFASGIYFSKFNKDLIRFAKEKMPVDKKTFFIYTCGAKGKGYTKAISEALKEHNTIILGEYGCLGFDSYGPFKLIGGIAKGHPSNKEIEEAVSFYESLLS